MLLSANRKLWLLTAILLLGFLSLCVSCSCGRRGRNPGGKKNALVAKFQNMDPKTKQACIDSCNTFCDKSQKCKVPKMENPTVCKKACLMLCAYNVMDEEMRECVKPESECPQVTECATKLADKLKNARGAQLKGAFGASGSPTAPAGQNAPPAPIPTPK